MGVPVSPSSSAHRLVRTLADRPWSLATRPVWQVGVLAVVLAAVVTESFALAARGVGVRMAAAGPGEKEAAEIAVGGVGQSVVFWSSGGIILAMALARWAKRPARTFLLTTSAFTAVSIAGPALATQTTIATQITLATSHVLAASVVIPALTLRLTRL